MSVPGFSGSQKKHWMPWNWRDGWMCAMWVMGLQPRVSKRATSALNFWANALVPLSSNFACLFEAGFHYVALDILELSMLTRPG